MYDVMQGVRVIEVAEHTFVPAAAMVLADWGADVIKIERRGGDAARHLKILHRPGQKHNAYFEVANRGKRSVGLDLTQAEGRAQLRKMLETADVFITNLRADARVKLGIEAADVMKINPRIIYARGTGYGTQGSMANDGGFDMPSSWCRSGSGFMQTPADGSRPPNQPGSVGDLMGGATLAGAISAALFRRERTGKGAIVDNALYLVGSYIMTQSLTGASLAAAAGPPQAGAVGGVVPPPALIPLVRLYKTSDQRWLMLCFLNDAWFIDLVRHLDRPELATDPRFLGEAAKFANAQPLIDELDAIFATRTLAEWNQKLATLEGVWAPLQSPAEVIADPQALVNGFVTPVTDFDGETYLSSASPGQFDEQPVGELRSSPAYGQHTDEVMRELGLTTDQVAALRAAKIVA
jgi:crotonobetainyl-CoA:carnitine CoA-transferase CaiB-like acyl-CoA transferase